MNHDKGVRDRAAGAPILGCAHAPQESSGVDDG
jgi:hypothetical protein